MSAVYRLRGLLESARMMLWERPSADTIGVADKEHCTVPDKNTNIWAPWRMEYIRTFADENDVGCFLCRYWEQPENDEKNHVLWRTSNSFVVMNLFPYTNGHLLVAPSEHKADFCDLTDEQLAELSRLVRKGVGLLRRTVRAQGINVGYNVGLCAGAGLPGHIHGHIVPRWTGDTNFMTVTGDVRVVPDSLDTLYDDLVKNLD